MNSIDELINTLKELDLRTTSDDVLFNLLRNIGDLALLGTEIKEGEFVLRARADSEYNPYYTEDDISYIKDLNVVPPYNRASYQGQSIFYGCITPDDEQYCTAQTVGEVSSLVMSNFMDNSFHYEYVTVGKWRVINNFTPVTLAHHSEFLNKNGRLKNMHYSYLKFVNAYPEKRENFLKVVDYFSSEFAKIVSDSERYNYKISAAFSTIIYKLGFEGIIYPSVRGEGKGFCIAIPPNVVDKCLRLEKIIVYRVIKQRSKMILAPYLFCDTFSPEGRFVYIDPDRNLSNYARKIVFDYN